MIEKSNYSLKNHNTFGLDVKAKFFIEVDTEEELRTFLLESPLKKELSLILGGGSNLLLTQDIEGTVLHINLKGKRIVNQDYASAIVEAQAGENWHELVLWAIEKNLGGIENLSLIPGNIGTAPMQNIGAYGVELKDVFYSLDALDIKTGKKHIFTNADCNFGYRESIFKNNVKGKFIITKVRLKLTKTHHKLSTQYGAIEGELKKRGISSPSIKDVSNAVITIRQSKLPDPKEIGNSGSFFKNPVISNEQALELQKRFKDIPVYPAQSGYKKIAAGWLIEKAGWKGFRKGDAGVHEKQALVLVNYGQARGSEIIEIARNIISSVETKFGIKLSPEVNILT